MLQPIHTRRRLWVEQLRRAGVPADLAGDQVIVAGTGPVDLPPRGTRLKPQAKRFIRRQTAEASSQLAARCRAALAGRAELAPRAKGGAVQILRGSAVVGQVTRYRVLVSNRAVLTGDLLSPEVDWSPVREALSKSIEPYPVAIAPTTADGEPQLAYSPGDRKIVPIDPIPPTDDDPTRQPQTERADTAPSDEGGAADATGEPTDKSLAGARRLAGPPGWEIWLDLPADLPASARDRALRASKRLRLERIRIPSLSVEVVTPRGSVTFEPLNERGNPLEASFRFENGSRQLEGGLRLKAPSDPIALRAPVDAPESFVGRVWALALIVYCELTCHRPEQEPRARGGDRTRARRAAQRHAAADSRRWTSVRSTPQPRGQASHPTVVAQRAPTFNIHAVEGHLRWLPVGHHSSPEARRQSLAKCLVFPGQSRTIALIVESPSQVLR